MRQTNNAIKFLLAQYRAIYKRAFMLGLATTAVLSMGVANADDKTITEGQELILTGTDAVSVTDGLTADSESGKDVATITGLTIDENATGVIIKNATTTTGRDEKFIYLNGDMTVKGTATVGDKNQPNNGVTIAAFSGHPNYGFITHNSALNISGNLSVYNSALEMGTVNVADGATLTIEGQYDTAAWNTSAHVSAYNATDEDSAFAVNIGKDSTVNLTNAYIDATDNKDINISGTVNLSGTEDFSAQHATFIGFSRTDLTGKLNIQDGAQINVNDSNDSNSVRGQLFAQYINVEDGAKITVGAQDKLLLAGVVDGKTTHETAGDTEINFAGALNNSGTTDIGDSDFETTLNITGGSITNASGATLNLNGNDESVANITGGTITNEGTITSNIAANVSGGQIVNKGTLTLNKDSSFDADTLDNSGTIAVNGGTLSVADVNDLGLNATENKGQVNIAKNATLALGDANLTVDNLASSTDAGNGKISFADGAQATFADLTVNGTTAEDSANNTLDIGSGSITADSLNLVFNAKEVSQPEEGQEQTEETEEVSTLAEGESNNTFIIASGNYTLENLTADNANTVQIGDTDDNATVNLVGSGNDLGDLNITVDGKDTGSVLNINEGTWTNGGDLSVTKGTATIAKGANATFASLTAGTDGKATIKGSLTVGALTAGASSVSVDGGNLTADGNLNLAANSVDVINAGSVTVNAGNVYNVKEEDGSIELVKNEEQGVSFVEDAITTDLTSKLVITGETEMTKDKFDAIKAAISKDSGSAFNGLLEFAGATWTESAKVEETFDNSMNGVAGYYDETNVKVDNETGTIASGTYDFGTVQVTDNLTLGSSDDSSDAGLTLSNANGGNFVSTNDDKVAGVAFDTDKSQLALKGDGNIGAITANNGGNGNVIIAGGNVSVVNDEGAANIGAGDGGNAVGSVAVQGGQLNVGSLYTNSLTSSGNIIATGDIVVGTNGGTITGGKVVAGGELTVKGDLNVVGTTDVVADTLNVDSGATFFLDPDWQYDATVGSFKDLSLAGQMIISKNTLAYFGDNLSQSEVRSNLASRLSETGVQALAYVDKAITVGESSGDAGQLIVDPAATEDNAGSNAVYVAEGSQLVVTGNALADGAAAISIDNSSNNNVTVNGTLALENVAVKDGQSYTVFGTTGTVTASTVTVDNKLYEASLSNGTVTINYDSDNAAANLAQTNASIANLVNTFAKNGGTFNQEATDGVGFVSKAVALDSAAQIGTALDSAALFVVAGGAPQVTLLAQNASTKAVESRLGFNADSSNMVVSEGVDASVWLSPIYSSTDMDGLDAGARSYGVDADLFGVAVGSDFNVANSAKFGLMFNIGSGSSDSQGNVAATSNDFDYIGVGLYGAYDYENFSIMGDLNYTVVDSDIDQYNQVQKLEGNVDSTAFSVGVQGKYTFAFDVIDVVPHLGVRYTALSVDDYTLGTTIRGDSIDQDIVTFPIGVTFSKEITAGSWMVKPLVDFSVIPAAGDTDTDVDVNFINFGAASVNADIVDSVSYGATLGLQVENNNFGFGLNVGYLGSENTDSYNVSANARYMF